MIGKQDEVLDLKYAGSADEYLAVATNSEDIQIIERATLHTSLLSGHTDMVLALDVSTDGEMLVSASKVPTQHS